MRSVGKPVSSATALTGLGYPLPMQGLDGGKRIATHSGIAIQTLISIVVSVVMTAALMYFEVGSDLADTVEAGRVWRMGLAISVIAPAIISPLLAYKTARLMRQLAQARDRMEEIAKQDALTGLLNRLGFQAAAKAMWSDLTLRGAPVGLLMIDIDRFKSINDTHGHETGDRALIHVAMLLREGVADAGGLLGRHGGEEFAVLLPGCDLRATAAVAERLRAKCEANPLALEAARLPLTVSVGAVAKAPHATPLHRMLAAADAGLYEAKLSGRNRVVAKDEGPQPAPQAA